MSFSVAIAVAGAKTNRDGRALLGVTADYLRRAYALIPDLPSYEGVQSNATDLLDRVNLYAQGIYAMVHDDDLPLDETLRPRIKVALDQAYSNLALVESVDANLQWNFLQALADVIPAGIAAVAGAVGSVALDHWFLTIVLIVAAIVVAPWVLRRVGLLRGAA